MKDPEDITAYRKFIKQQRVHIFLAGLDGDFEQVRGEILRKDLLPDLEECYALIRREAVRHASMKVEYDNPDTSTMLFAEIKIEANVTEKASALVAATDYGDKFLNTSIPVINSAWIIDSGATDHMTFDSRQVSPLIPSSQKVVFTANGNTTPVIREGSLTLIDTLNLDSVLVVPSVDYNILSVLKSL
ncbi:hypothetical protein CK203_102023 [Vitis vinifera]|uniref:Retrovirus-related Pol polyprotein from transposon TNT 1-94-like beta-barrel domain-containing protein n=1 Tax=Vitis vinifera TaxID=29760 RepID=A0A438D8I4_VITVI|nr:hypothetical protein CK203_102023 [Vitis vinifera]